MHKTHCVLKTLQKKTPYFPNKLKVTMYFVNLSSIAPSPLNPNKRNNELSHVLLLLFISINSLSYQVKKKKEYTSTQAHKNIINDINKPQRYTIPVMSTKYCETMVTSSTRKRVV